MFCIIVNECEVDNGGCEHLCMDQPKSFSCGCRSGYTLDSNGRNCTGEYLVVLNTLL